MAIYETVRQEVLLGRNPRITILHTVIDVLNAQETVDLVERYVITKTPLHIMGVNADKINQVNQNTRMMKIVNSCGVIHADGGSIVIASRFLGKPLPERVAGIDLMQKLVALSEDKGYTVYLLGAKQTVVEKTAEVLKGKFPELNLAGIHNGYFDEHEWPAISKELKEKKPDFVFVGITSPLKEYFIEYLQESGHTSVFMGVGGSFDVISGSILRAPVWMQKSNLEWLFRAIQEPKRLLRRYFLGNWTFIAAIIKERIAGRQQ